MKTWFPLLATLGALTLGACGPATSEPAAGEALGSSSAALNTCTNDCAAYGGPSISCTGNTCLASGDYVVCDGVTTYCRRTCTNDCAGYDGNPVSCTGSTCSTGSNFVVCDGVYTYCRETCTSPMVLCPDFSQLRCTGSTCGLGSTGCSVRCDGVEYSCPNVPPDRHCLNDA